ncbi:hypothetical protein DFJ58DRAFT_744413 [Suillus subalutaceus]|uniref:uncharacterized protein n=1 Tax=Suillus subalutaceus TaxID=48586 RepID=UPI001B87CF5E|nr:uncharacterized protein DFJ58DRAFT_744413 [Suillus subalutaceus]KAG1860690.1 hypothetical protein DFJ58DRAFT_744413 [Suillus subalutaceus]
MSETQETSTARAPFNNPDHDIVLRSTDGVDFHHFKLILSLVSPMFDGMFTLPQSKSELAVPVILVPEPSTILYPLLLLSYPSAGADPIFNNIDDASAVLEAARKYQMDAIIYRIGDLVAAQFLPAHPLGVYAVSCLAGWEHHARTAAARSLEIKSLGRPSSEFAGMGAIGAVDYHRLLKYHYECGVAAQAVGESLEWLPSTPYIKRMQMWQCVACRRGPAFGRLAIQIASFGKLTVTPWFEKYLLASRKELANRPCELTLWESAESASYDRAIVKARDCLACQFVAHHELNTFRTFYINEVKKAIAKVNLAS